MAEKRLAIVIDPRGAQTGGRVVRRNLNDISRSAAKAENSAKGLDAANRKMANSARGASGVLRSQTTATTHLTGAMSKARVAASALGAAMVAAFATKAIRSAFSFRDALAEVSTLVNIATFDMKALEQSALSQAAAFGSSPTAQAQAFYSLISSGASSASEAILLLNASNKLAIGGVTDVQTAAKGLGIILNAYGLSAEHASDVSDMLFVGMKAGTTTIGELSAGLGQVAALASKAGVSIPEMVSSVAALTKVTGNTNTAITQFKAILSGVVKPGEQARKVVKDLSVEFGDAGVKAAGGWEQFLKTIISETGGSTEKIGKLFESIEALSGMMTFAGAGMESLTANMVNMGNRAGESAEAFRKIEENSPGQKAAKLWGAITVELTKLGNVAAGPLSTAMETLTDNLTAIIDVAQRVGAVLLVAFSGQIIGVVVGLAVAIGGRLVKAVLLLNAAMRTNPFVLFATVAVGAYEAITAFNSGVGKAAAVMSPAAKAAAALTMKTDEYASALKRANTLNREQLGILRANIAMSLESARAEEAKAKAKATVAVQTKIAFDKIMALRGIVHETVRPRVEADAMRDATANIGPALKKAAAEVIPLTDNVKRLKAEWTAANNIINGVGVSINGLPSSKTISIFVKKYEVSAGSGSSLISVFSGAPDSSATTGGTSGTTGSGTPYTTTVNGVVVHGSRASGGPVGAGQNYLVGEQGPELLKMAGSGMVTNAGETASILSGSRSTLTLMEDHLFGIRGEMENHTEYWSTFEGDFQASLGLLRGLKSNAGAGGSSGSVGASTAAGIQGPGGTFQGKKIYDKSDPKSPYYFNPGFATGGGVYDPMADLKYNNNPAALLWLKNHQTPIPMGAGNPNGLTFYETLIRQMGLEGVPGFATGGQILPGEDQRVEFFKRRNERVIIVDDDRVADRRQNDSGSVPAINLHVEFHGQDLGDNRARQATVDDFRDTVRGVVSEYLRGH